MAAMAAFRARRNRSSTAWLRTRYQRRASRPSAMASGWRLTILRIIRRIEDLPLGFLPRNGLYRAGSNFLETALRLGRPSRISALVRRPGFDALEEGLGQVYSRVLRQREGFLQELLSDRRHEPILVQMGDRIGGPSLKAGALQRACPLVPTSAPRIFTRSSPHFCSASRASPRVRVGRAAPQDLYQPA
jgi:hypothetical protein